MEATSHERARGSLPGVCRKAPERHSDYERQTLLLFDETKNELFGVTVGHHGWKKPGTAHQLANTIPTVRGGQYITFCYQQAEQQSAIVSPSFFQRQTLLNFDRTSIS